MPDFTNMKVEVKGKQLIVTIDTAGATHSSASGKTDVVASTQGNKPIVVDGKTLSLGVNAYFHKG